MNDPVRVFGLHATRPLGNSIAKGLGVSLFLHEERDFDDGERKSRPLVTVRACSAQRPSNISIRARQWRCFIRKTQIAKISDRW
ncbi:MULTISPECIES: hypothetical protein [unclassified Imperialibacter]|uniref:hypothetical protein n=1 Tax=unclassified Imperialibacter TaxID=2629706 RepID=UPI00125ED97A|nr:MULTISPECIES: hypothetical protein [unclassified Imperialibacter]